MSSKTFAIAAVANAQWSIGAMGNNVQFNDNSLCPPIPEVAMSTVCKVVSLISKNAPIEMVKDGCKAYHKVCCSKPHSQTTTAAPGTTGSDVTTADPSTTGSDVTTTDAFTTSSEISSPSMRDLKGDNGDHFQNVCDLSESEIPDGLKPLWPLFREQFCQNNPSHSTTAAPETTGSDVTTADPSTTGSDVSTTAKPSTTGSKRTTAKPSTTGSKRTTAKPSTTGSKRSTTADAITTGSELSTRDLQWKGNHDSIFSKLCGQVPDVVLKPTCMVPASLVKNKDVLFLFESFKSACCTAQVVVV